MLKKKKLWDVVNETKLESTTIAQTKKKDKNNAICSKIIKQRVNSDSYINIIGERNLH